MATTVLRVLRFWWVFVGIVFAAVGLIQAARDAQRPIWFWLFCAAVPVVIGISFEWHRLWARVNNESRILRGVGRRLDTELDSMGRDLDRVERATRYDGFTPLPSDTWTTERTRFEQLDVYPVIAEAYVLADAFNKDIVTRKALAGSAPIGVIPQDGIPVLRAAIKEARDALSRL